MMNTKRGQGTKLVKFRPLLWIAAAVLIGWLSALSYGQYKLWVIAENISNQNVTGLIRDAEEARYKSPLIDMANQKVVIYEAGLTLPLNNTTRDVRYDIRGDQIYLSLDGVIGRQNLDDQNTPPTCDKVAILSKTLDSGIESMHYVDDVQGENLDYRHIYKHAPCNIFSTDSQDRLIEALRLAEKN